MTVKKSKKLVDASSVAKALADKKAMAGKGGKTDDVSKEGDAEFLKRIMRIKDDASKKAQEEMNLYSAETEEFKAQGKRIGKDLEEIEECEKIAEEFKKNPPIVISKRIGGISVDYHYEEKYQKKVDLLKKHGFPFISAVQSTSIHPVVFNAFGNAYIKRGGKKVILPESIADLPLIIRDGDIIGTEKRSFVLELKDEEQDEDNDYWHIFIFPNSELKISISERITKPEPTSMEPEKIPEAIKKNSSSTVYSYSIKNIELLSGLFNLRIKKKNKDINNLVRFTSGFPEVEFSESGGLTNELVKDAMEKAVAQLGAAYLSKVAGSLAEIRSKSGKHGGDDLSAFVELNKDGSVVIFATNNRVALKGSGKMTKKISTDMYNPVKITAVGGALYETDGKINPDSRVTAIMKMWMAVSSYISSFNAKNEYEYKQRGKSLSIEKAQKMAEYAKTLGDKDMESAAKTILINKEQGEQMEKQIKDMAANTEGQKREAAEMLKNAEEIGDEELIEVAKAQVKSVADGNPFGVRVKEVSGMTLEEFARERSLPENENVLLSVSPQEGQRMAMEFNEKNLEKFRPQVEIDLPPYSSPNSSDVV